MLRLCGLLPAPLFSTFRQVLSSISTLGPSVILRAKPAATTTFCFVGYFLIFFMSNHVIEITRAFTPPHPPARPPQLDEEEDNAVTSFFRKGFKNKTWWEEAEDEELSTNWRT